MPVLRSATRRASALRKCGLSTLKEVKKLKNAKKKKEKSKVMQKPSMEDLMKEADVKNALDRETGDLP